MKSIPVVLFILAVIAFCLSSNPVALAFGLACLIGVTAIDRSIQANKEYIKDMESEASMDRPE